MAKPEREEAEKKPSPRKDLQNILLLEDDPFDVQLIKSVLNRVWPGTRVVHTSDQEHFEAALDRTAFDVVLCDFHVPGYDSIEAFKLCRKKQPETPFIVVTGFIRDDAAVELLQAGVTDYILKDRLARLAPAIERSLLERHERRLRQNAEARLRRRHEELLSAHETLRCQNQEISGFFHTLSHELKTPLTAATEFISITQEGIAGPTTETQREYLSVALTSCQQIRRSIDDLLDAARLQTGKLTLVRSPMDLEKTVQTAMQVAQIQAGQRQVNLQLRLAADLPEIRGDEQRLAQILNNLLDNGIRHTPQGGEVVVDVTSAGDLGRDAQICVHDSGPGVPEEERERIFERFYQIATAEEMKRDGLGLGLYLCRQLVELHGGKIWIKNRPGKGSSFCFTLPGEAEHNENKPTKKASREGVLTH